LCPDAGDRVFPEVASSKAFVFGPFIFFFPPPEAAPTGLLLIIGEKGTDFNATDHFFEN